MPDKTSYISQIQEEEAMAAKMLKQLEEENDKRLLQAIEDANLMVLQAEEEERQVANDLISKAKGEAKVAYGKFLTDSNNARRDVIESGKVRITAGKKKVVEAFMTMFD